MANDIIEMTILEDDAPLSMSVVDHDPYYVGAEAKVEAVTNGAKITCKDKSGTTTATVYNGVNGQDGSDGQDGEDGNGIASVTLNDDYTLTILLTDGTSVTTESIRGEQGEAGQDGADGEDGVSPTVTVETIVGGHQVAITDAEGTSTFNVMDGVDGQDGADGSDGEDGFSPSASVSKSGSTVTITITDKDGTTTESVTAGVESETDPIFLASAAHDIASSDITSWNGKYEKPSGGIPKTDLESAVQTSLGKADTALQSFTETDPTVPSWAKASSKPSYTASEVGALPDTTAIPSKTSDLTNDSGFITSSALPTALSDLTNDMDVSDFPNDAGYLTSFTETDPTVPSWAKASTKPSYTATEVGALPSTTFIPSDTDDLTNGAGFITSSALPTALSDLTNDLDVSDFPNDAGYLTTHQDISGKADKVDTDIDSSVNTLFTALGWTAPS